ncbi:alcohol dehydrogenase catalytic domain-containing protein [Klebsiella pneumoniae]
MMNAVIARQPGGPEVLEQVQRAGAAAFGGRSADFASPTRGVNRPDIMQRNGMPLPPGITDVLGLEVSGTVVAQGAGVESPAIGAPVMALLNGGGYADYCVARAELCLSVPKKPAARAGGGRAGSGVYRVA